MSTGIATLHCVGFFPVLEFGHVRLQMQGTVMIKLTCLWGQYFDAVHVFYFFNMYCTVKLGWGEV